MYFMASLIKVEIDALACAPRSVVGVGCIGWTINPATSGVRVVAARRGGEDRGSCCRPARSAKWISRSSIHSHLIPNQPTTASPQSMAAVGVPTPKRAPSSTSPGRPPAGPESRIRSMRQIKQVRHA